MNILEVLMTVVIGILLLLIVVQWLIMYDQTKENENLEDFANRYASRFAKTNRELAEYKIREKEVERYKPPYKIGQRVMYNDESIARVGYIRSIRTEQSMHVINNISKVVVEHAYEIENDYFTDIIDVVKENKE